MRRVTHPPMKALRGPKIDSYQGPPAPAPPDWAMPILAALKDSSHRYAYESFQQIHNGERQFLWKRMQKGDNGGNTRTIFMLPNQ